MTGIETLKPDSRDPQLWPMSLQAYHTLGELGLIAENTELLYGQVFRKISKTPLHSYLSWHLEDALRAAVLPGWRVRGGKPLTWGDSEPEPDLAVVRGQRENYRQQHPTTAELVIEVCISSHEYDRAKLRAYAGAGVQEVWLVLGPERQIEVHRQPAIDQYGERTVHGPGGKLSSVVFPGFEVELNKLFGK